MYIFTGGGLDPSQYNNNFSKIVLSILYFIRNFLANLHILCSTHRAHQILILSLSWRKFVTEEKGLWTRL